MFPEMIKEDFKNPILASVAATFPMALMLLSTYIKPFIGVGAKYIWYFAIGLHIILIVYFTIKFLLKLQMPKVFASYFIVYVGIAVAAVTAPAFEELAIGAGAFWFGFLTFIGLLVLVATVLYVLALVKAIRYLKLKFYPSYAAFTFPFVISAIATKQTMVCLANMKQPIPMLRYVVLIETVIAVLFMIYTFIRFLQFIFVDHK